MVFVQISTASMQLIGLLLRDNKLVVSIIGALFFILLSLYPLLLQPFFNTWGNVCYSCVLSISLAGYITGIICSIINPNYSSISS